MCVYVCMVVYANISAYVGVWVCGCTGVYVNSSVCVCVCKCIHVNSIVYVCVCVCVCVSTCT